MSLPRAEDFFLWFFTKRQREKILTNLPMKHSSHRHSTGLALSACRRSSAIGFLLFFLTAIFVIAFASVPVNAAIPQQQTRIENQASVRFIDSDTGQERTISSNVADFLAAGTPNLSLIQDQSLSAQSGASVTFLHTLTNTGNFVDRYNLALSNLPNTDFELANFSVIIDSNNNGEIDANEVEITQTAGLAPLQSINLIVRADVPVNLANGSLGRLSLVAFSAADSSVLQSNTDSVTVNNNALLELSKSNIPACEVPALPGSTIRYTLTAQNTGVVNAASGEYLINGAARQGFILTDIIPANTRLLADQDFSALSQDTLPLVQLAAEFGTNRWINFSDWAGEPVAAIGLFTPESALASGQSVQFEFGVVLGAFFTPGTEISNRFFIDTDSDQNREFVSNDVCNTTLSQDSNGDPQNAIIRFLEPAYSVQMASATPDFFTDEDFIDASVYRLSGTPDYRLQSDGIYLELRSTSLNTVSYSQDGVSRAILVTLSSEITGDTLQVVMLETAPNSAIFRSVRPIELSPTQRGEGAECGEAQPAFDMSGVASCVLQSAENDRLRASILDPGLGSVIADSAVVNPGSVVFDSLTGELIAGALVQVIDARTDQPAINPRLDGAQSFEGSVSDGAGRFDLPALAAGDYYLSVLPPPAYQFPSAVAIDELAGDFLVVDASYGQNGPQNITNSGVFTVEVNQLPTLFDVPLDPGEANGNGEGPRLIVEKNIDIGGESVEFYRIDIGDRIKYRVEIQNTGTEIASLAVLHDTFPYGFKYESDTLKVGSISADPLNENAGELRVNLGDLEPGETRSVSYVLKVSAGAIDSDGINRATAQAENSSGELIRSDEASARVEINRRGLLSDRTVLFGKVFVDAQCDHIQNRGEWPLGGVRIYMEDGTYVITDENGQYSLYGIKPGNHVLKMDRTSLPEGIYAIPSNPRFAADPYSRFVDVVSFEFHRADFTFACPQKNAETVFEQITERNKSINGDWLFEQALDYQGNFGLEQRQFSSDRVRPGIDGDISSAVIGEQRLNRTLSNELTGAEREMPITGIDNRAEDIAAKKAASNEYDGTTATITDVESTDRSLATGEKKLPTNFHTVDKSDHIFQSTEEAAEGITNEMARKGEWLWPKSDISHSGRFVVVVRAGVTPTLMLNGSPVSQEKLGEQLINKEEKAQVFAWYGVDLKTGNNDLEVTAVDPFGNQRSLAKKQVYHPGRMQTLTLTPMLPEIAADRGASVLPFEIRALDLNGRPALGTYYATIEAEDGAWFEQDTQDLVQGFQVKISDGVGVAHLRSSERAGKVLVRASVNELAAQAEVRFIPVLRPMLAVGLVDIGATFNNFDNENIQPTDHNEGFADGFDVDGRVALFLKGKVKGDLLLTLSYDSKRDDEELFRDIDPEAYYPIYGDASIRGYDAQSRSKLYIKLEKERSSILWGDFQTDTNAPLAQSLTRVNQTLTGLNAIYENKRGTRLSVFAAEAENQFETAVIRGQGLATGYQLERATLPVLRNSEQISLITFDRENSSRDGRNGQIIEEVPLERFRDYTLNTLTGILNFTEPVPSIDSRGNPVFIRATYQSESNPGDHMVAGFRLAQTVMSSLTLGISGNIDDDVEEGYSMGSVFAEFQPSDRHHILAEFGYRENELESDGEGQAFQLQWKSKWSDKLETEVRHGKAEEGYTNSLSPVSSGREETRAQANYAITSSTVFAADVLKSASIVPGNENERTSATVSLAQQFGAWTLTGGVRQTEQKNNGNSVEFSTGVARVDRSFSIKDRSGRVFVEGERELGGDRSRVETSLEMQLTKKISGYVRHELTDSLSGPSSLDNDSRRQTTSLGVKTDLIKNAQTYSEYRIRGAIDGRDVETVNGVRGSWEVKPGLAVSPALERVDTLEGETGRDATAVSIAVVDNRAKNSKKALRLETRLADTGDTYSLDYSYAGRISEDWSSLFINRFRLNEQIDGDDQLRNALTLSFARRPKRSNVWNSLYLAQWKEERNLVDDERSVFLLSTHQNLQLGKDWLLSGRLATKWQTQTIDNQVFDSTSQLLGGRLLYTVNRRWDIDLRGGILSSDLEEDFRYSAGLGANYLVDKNLRLGAGFNFTGFDDEDLDDQKFHSEGFFFGVQYKFDEALFEWLR